MSREAGIYAAVILTLIILWKKRVYLALVVFLIELLALQIDHKKFSYMCFIALLLIYMTSPDPVSETECDEVIFKPHEEKIRKYLMQKDPSMLHRVSFILRITCNVRLINL